VYFAYDNFLTPAKTFKVFGEPVEILTDSKVTKGKSTTITQISPPGGGPPPHSHSNEDETFVVLEGEFDFLVNGEWRKLMPGDTVHALRGSVHTFRNAGATNGKILIFVVPGGFETYLEEISPLSIPEDMEQILAVSERYGISFAV
jgi:quercetin dioxygenase-like cupin family protein